MTKKSTVFIRLEPSKRLSEMIGYPYVIERKYSIKELLAKDIITENDLEKIRNGQEILKRLRVKKDVATT